MDRASRLYAYAWAVEADSNTAPAEARHFTEEQCASVVNGLSSAVGSNRPPVSEGPLRPTTTPLSGPRPSLQLFEQKAPLFLAAAAVAHRMSLRAALLAFSRLDHGFYLHDDRSYFSVDPAVGPVSDRPRALQRAERMVLKGAAGKQDLTLFLVHGHIAAISGQRRVRISWLNDAYRSCGGLETLPDFIALPRDEHGHPIIPAPRGHGLGRQLGTLDGVTSAITQSKMVMPKLTAPTQQTALQNHLS